MGKKLTHTFQSYMERPMGKGVTAFQLNSIRADLTSRYKKLNLNSKISLVHVCKLDDRYFIHFLIPNESEDDRNNDYDVVLEFIPSNKAIASEPTIRNYNIKFFSNCPSFVYTFAYIYNDNGLLIEEFKDKFEDQVLSMKPVSRNPYKIVNFEKTIFFACMNFQYKSIRFNKQYLDSKCNVKFNKLKTLIRHTKTVKMEIAKEKKRIRELKREEKALQDKNRKEILNNITKYDNKQIHHVNAKSTIGKSTKNIMRAKSNIGGKKSVKTIKSSIKKK